MAIVNIQVMGEFMPSMRIHDAENVRILSTTDEDEAMAIYNACQYPVSLKKQSHADIIFNDSWLSIRVVYLDDAIENYENFTIKDSLPAKDRDSSYPACTIENNLFKIYRWRVGELLKIDGKEMCIRDRLHRAELLYNVFCFLPRRFLALLGMDCFEHP